MDADPRGAENPVPGTADEIGALFGPAEDPGAGAERIDATGARNFGNHRYSGDPARPHYRRRTAVLIRRVEGLERKPL